MKQKILIIANPKAGKSKANKYLEIIKQNLEKQNYDVEIFLTTKENTATDVLKNSKYDFEKIIVCGGDGTLNETVQGLYELNKKVPIGFIPFGTINDFAKTLGVSFNKIDISQNIEQYQYKQVDLGKINNHIFDYTATFGIFSKTSYLVSYKTKNRIGKLAYWFSGIKEIFNFKTYNLKITSEEQKIDGNFVFGAICNSKYIGGFPLFKKNNVKIDDSKFEVILVKECKNIFKILRLTLKVITGNLRDENIYYFKTSNISIQSDNEIEWSLDGEYGGKVKKVEIQNLPKYMTYLLPKNLESEGEK